MRRHLLTLAAIFWVGSTALAEAPLNRIWFTWEQRATDRQLCAEKGHCDPVSRFITRLAEETDRKSAEQITGSMARLAERRGQSAEHPEAPNWCQQTDAQAILGFEAESWPESEKIKTLEGLEGVHFELSNLRGPYSYIGDFGPNVQAEVVRKFDIAGIPVLSAEEVKITPGKPILNVYFSNTDPDTGCWFSVFAALSQTMLLTRNHTIKIRAGSWGMSGGYSNENPDRAEFDAIMLVIDRFIEDFKAANPGGVGG
ncbi:MAG: hypothetical protein AAF429_00725 [Pseudomonadota bacterium]